MNIQKLLVQWTCPSRSSTLWRDTHKFGICKSCMGTQPMPITEMLNLCVSTVMFAYSKPVSHV